MNVELQEGVTKNIQCNIRQSIEWCRGRNFCDLMQMTQFLRPETKDLS